MGRNNHRSPRHGLVAHRALPARQVFFGFPAGAQTCHPRAVFQDSQSHVRFQRVAGPWLPTYAATSVAVFDPGCVVADTDHTRASGSESAGRNIRRRVPRISQEDLVLMKQTIPIFDITVSIRAILVSPRAHALLNL